MSSGSQAVSPVLREQFVDPFVEATRVSMSDWATTDVVVQEVYEKTFDKPYGDISALLELTSGPEEALVLGFPQRTGAGLAKRVFAGVLENLDTAIIHDCLGEFGNVIAGQAKALLAGTPYHFIFSTPSVVAGTGPEIDRLVGKRCLVIVFACDLGDFALQLLLSR